MKILIVDDSRVCRLMYRKELQKGGYETVEAQDGLDALAVIDDTAVDLVLLDIEMPNMNGYEVCERLRSSEFSRKFGESRDQILPVIFVTSNQTAESRHKGLSKGANDFITKGFKPGALLEAVDRILRPKNPLQGLQILTVSCHEALHEKIQKSLQEHNAEVFQAKDGDEALRLFDQHETFDVAILDYAASDPPVDELARIFRKELGLRSMPIIVIIEQEARGMLVRLFEAGVTEYLTHPLEKDDLLVRIQASLESMRSMEEAIQHRLGSELQTYAANAELVGAAEMASSVIHNIGNVLNSVVVSLFQVSAELNNSKLPQLLLANRLIIDHADDLARFVTEDKRAELLPEYLDRCGDAVKGEHANLGREIQDIATKINLMKDIIEVQQAHARGSNITASTKLERLVEEALKVQSGQIQKHGIKVVKHFESLQALELQRTTMTHIIINLVKNAVEAMTDVETRTLTLRIEAIDGDQRLTIQDTGVGMDQVVLDNLFSHGFTTKKEGHGFGLSYCSRMIGEMDGRLEADSDGPGLGSRFMITLPGERADGHGRLPVG